MIKSKDLNRVIEIKRVHSLVIRNVIFDGDQVLTSYNGKDYKYCPYTGRINGNVYTDGLEPWSESNIFPCVQYN